MESGTPGDRYVHTVCGGLRPPTHALSACFASDQMKTKIHTCLTSKDAPSLCMKAEKANRGANSGCAGSQQAVGGLGETT